MKYFVTVGLMLIINSIGVSQFKFLDEDAHWIHRMSSIAGWGYMQTINTNVDTLIEMNTYTQFDRIGYFYNNFNMELDSSNFGPLLLREENRKVFQYREADESEIKIYDFNLSLGDTLDFLDFKHYNTENSTVTVTSIGKREVNGDSLDFQVLKFEGLNLVFSALITEKLGSELYNLLLNEIADPFGDLIYHKLCSYSSSQFQNFDSELNNCFDINDFISSNQETESSQFRIYPNPNTDYFYLEKNFSGQINYKLIDVNGRVVRKGCSKENLIKVNMEGIISNLYFLIIESNGDITVEKIVRS